jgi:hypothetical protein
MRAWTCLFGAGLLVGCGPTPEAPQLSSVAPDWGWTGESTDITVVGDHLFPTVYVGDQREEVQFDSSFQLFLSTNPPTPLDAVQYVDTHTLSAEVPPGIEPGTYGIQMVSPSGQASTLADAFRVADTRADHLAFSVETVGYDVTELAMIGLQLADPDGRIVPMAMHVEVRAESAQDASGVEFGDGLLDNQQPLSDGVGVSGNLHADGTATLLLRSTLAQDLTLTLTALDEPQITSDTTLLSFAPGVPDHIELTLPTDEFAMTAGDSVNVGIEVVDAAGNVIDASGLRVLVYEDCGQLRQSIDLLQAGPYPITLSTACAGDRLHAIGLGVDEAVSKAFDVLPAAMSSYRVRAVPGSVVAGSGVLAVQVDALDAFENLVTDHAATITLSDSIGGLTADVGVQNCDPFVGGQTVCAASPIRAGNDVVLTATDDDGFSGASNRIQVLPGAPVEVRASVGAASVEAGVPFSLGLQVVDEWSNPVAWTFEAVNLTDDTGTLDCEPSADGNFMCVVTASDPSDVISVTTYTLSTSTAPFPVTNSDLAFADVLVTSTTVFAGQTFNATVRGFDGFGNAYTTPVSGSGVSLYDALGGTPTLSLNLDVAGTATTAVVLTVAGADRLSASAGGVLLGSSSTLTVDAGSMANLGAYTPAWADISDGVPVEIVASDAWGNPVPSYAGPASVSLPGCASAVVTDFTAGSADVDLACVAAALQQVVAVQDGAFSGVSTPLDLLDFGCADGPVADLQLNGSSETIACLVASEAAVVVDSSGSTPGAAALRAWHLGSGDGDELRYTSSPVELVYDLVGARRATLVVADADGCADEATAVAWIGEDDGSPVGPITVSATNSSVRNGGLTSVALSATDCAGDVASGGLLYVWADLGTVTGTSTGEGMVVTLDSVGTGSVDWSFADGYADTATFSAASATGAGFGTASVLVTDDSVRPQVVSVSPEGAEYGTVSDITVVFSEPMLPAAFTASNVTLSGPSGQATVSLSLSSDGKTLTITPSPSVDAAAGVFVVGLTTNVRDAAGNRLSGDGSGSAANWSSTFGAVAASVPATSCTASSSAFRPDGDDGSGADADALTLALSGAPTRWSMWVADDAGNVVRHAAQAGSIASWDWDGRSDDGLVVAEGEYRVDVYALDASSNRQLGCSIDVQLTQRGRAP